MKQNCANCKFILHREADEDVKKWGIKTTHSCKKYQQLVADLGFVAIKLPRELVLSPQNDGLGCLHWKSREKQHELS